MQGCPKDYTIKFAVQNNLMSASCEPCKGKDCWKLCLGADLRSIEDVRKMKGCQVIEGSLKLQVQGKHSKKNLVKELEDALGDIIEIEGFLEISRMNSIMSLSFFKSLKVIRGSELSQGRFSLIIWDNLNLETLFTAKLQTVDLLHGKVKASHNSKLCFHHVENIANTTDRIFNYEASKAQNGDKTDCASVDLKISDKDISDTSIVMSIEPINVTGLIGFTVFYIETPTQNVDRWQGRDAYSDDE